MEKAYHGKTLGALSITHSNKYRKAFEGILLPNVQFVKFGDSASLLSLLKSGDVAAVFMEPIQGEGGINFPPYGYMEAVRETTRENGTLLVMDEIQSGLGRTGKMWAHEHWGIVPDIMTVGKGIGGGIPMGVTIGKKEFMESLDVGEQSSTTGGNPLACAAGSALIGELESGMLHRVTTMGRFALKRISEETEGHRLVSQARGMGLMLAIDLRVRFVPVLMELLQMGLITLYSGINTIRMLPPYTVTEEEVNKAAEFIRLALNKQLNK